MATDAWGIDDGWWAMDGTWHPTPPDTLEALRGVMAPPSEARPPWYFVREGSDPPWPSRAELELESGDVVMVSGALPSDLPPGYHRAHPVDGSPDVRVVVTPEHAPRLPPRAWGVTCQIPSLRGSDLTGAAGRAMGDLGHLRDLARWIGSRGGTVVGVNPLGDPLPLTPRHASPYSTSSRRFLDPLLIRLDMDHEPSSEPLVDRDALWAAHRRGLAERFATAGGGELAAVAAFRRLHGDALEAHALFNALVERFGTGWPAWPSTLHDPRGEEVRRAAGELAADVDFWCWVQWLADVQLSEATASVELMCDLPVGVDPWGFDAWWDAHVLARGVSVGAPPDPFAPDGQDWGLPPYDPVALRAADYEPWLSTLRAGLRRGAGLRIDHVMQLFRLFWIPPAGTPAEGAYVRWQGQELLDLLVLEATRAGAWVVGEDLGTVEDGVRELLAERGVAGTKVAWFESDPPDRWAAHSLGTLSTHDLPTVMGALTGTDPRPGDMAERLRSMVGPEHDDDPVATLLAAHRRLAEAGSDLVLAGMEDVVGSPRRVNLPGVNDYPSWRQRLPVPVDMLDTDPTALAVSDALARTRPRPC